jgi:hypothetical protein
MALGLYTINHIEKVEIVFKVFRVFGVVVSEPELEKQCHASESVIPKHGYLT